MRARPVLCAHTGLGQYVSGAITFEETLFHKGDDGTPFVELMKREGIIPGIKVDKVRGRLGRPWHARRMW